MKQFALFTRLVSSVQAMQQHNMPRPPTGPVVQHPSFDRAAREALTPKPAPGKCADPSTANVKQLRSTDYGGSWAPVEDISSQVLDPKLSPIFKLGEGSGVRFLVRGRHGPPK